MFITILTSDEFAHRLAKSTSILLGETPLDVGDVTTAFHTYLGAYLASTKSGMLRFWAWLLEPLRWVGREGARTLASLRAAQIKKAAKAAAKANLAVAPTKGKKRRVEGEAEAPRPRSKKPKVSDRASASNRPPIREPLSALTNTSSAAGPKLAPSSDSVPATSSAKERRQILAERFAGERRARRAITPPESTDARGATVSSISDGQAPTSASR